MQAIMEDIKLICLGLLLASVIFVMMFFNTYFPPKGALEELEYKNLAVQACKNDTEALEKFEKYYVYYVANDTVLIRFFQKLVYLKNPFVDYLLAVHIKNNTFKHKEYLGSMEIEKNFKEVLYLLRRSKEYEKTKIFLNKYKNLSDDEIISIWKKELEK